MYKTGTIVYIDGIKTHMGIVDGHNEDNYIIRTQVIDGVMCEDEVSIPMECCLEASTEDQQYLKSIIDGRPQATE